MMLTHISRLLRPAAIKASGEGTRYYRRGNAAGLAIMGMMIGTMAAAIAARQRRDAYYDYDGYRPGYYGPPPVHYGPPSTAMGPILAAAFIGSILTRV